MYHDANIHYQRVYGVTGIIGSGKSTVANLLSKKGAFVISADNIARDLLNHREDKNIIKPIIQQLHNKLEVVSLKLYNQSLFNKEGKVDRMQLSQLVFNHPQYLKYLNQLLHPEVEKKFIETVKLIPQDKIILYDIPLLFETKLHHKVKKIILVYTTQEIAIQRAIMRANMKEKQIKKIIASQISIEEKKHKADYVIDNGGDFRQLEDQLSNIWDVLTRMNSL